MKTFLVIIVTAAVTWMAASLIHAVQTGTERLWLISAVKVPGRMALNEIQADLNSGRYEVVKAKVGVLIQAWQRFDSGAGSFQGSGIGDVMLTFSKLDTNGVTIRP